MDEPDSASDWSLSCGLWLLDLQITYNSRRVIQSEFQFCICAYYWNGPYCLFIYWFALCLWWMHALYFCYHLCYSLMHFRYSQSYLHLHTYIIIRIVLIKSFIQSTSRQQLWNEVKLPLQRAINTLSESQWKLVQDSLQCCGYMKQNRTATICTESTSDCETFLYGQMDMLYIVAAFIIVLFVLLVIADSSSCSWMRALRLLQLVILCDIVCSGRITYSSETSINNLLETNRILKKHCSSFYDVNNSSSVPTFIQRIKWIGFCQQILQRTRYLF